METSVESTTSVEITTCVESTDEKFERFFPTQMLFINKIKEYHIQMMMISEIVKDMYDLEFGIEEKFSFQRISFFPTMRFKFKMKIRPISFEFYCERIELDINVKCNIDKKSQKYGCGGGSGSGLGDLSSYESIGIFTTDFMVKIIQMLKSHHELCLLNIKHSELILSSLTELFDTYQEKIVCYDEFAESYSSDGDFIEFRLDEREKLMQAARLCFKSPSSKSKSVVMYGGMIQLIDVDYDLGLDYDELPCCRVLHSFKLDTEITDDAKFTDMFQKHIRSYFDVLTGKKKIKSYI